MTKEIVTNDAAEKLSPKYRTNSPGEGGRMVTIYAIYVSSRIRETILGGKVALRLLRIAGD